LDETAIKDLIVPINQKWLWDGIGAIDYTMDIIHGTEFVRLNTNLPHYPTIVIATSSMIQVKHAVKLFDALLGMIAKEEDMPDLEDLPSPYKLSMQQSSFGTEIVVDYESDKVIDSGLVAFMRGGRAASMLGTFSFRDTGAPLTYDALVADIKNMAQALQELSDKTLDLPNLRLGHASIDTGELLTLFNPEDILSPVLVGVPISNREELIEAVAVLMFTFNHISLGYVFDYTKEKMVDERTTLNFEPTDIPKGIYNDESVRKQCDTLVLVTVNYTTPT